MIKPNLSSYFRESRKPIYSFILSVPLFLLYEVGIILINSEDLPILRNGGDVLIRNFLESFGFLGIYSTGILLILGFLLVLFIQRNTLFKSPYRKDVLPKMVAESFLWSLALYFFMGVFRQVYFSITVESAWFAQIVMSLGAGIYEEIIFRLLLITFFVKIIQIIFSWGKNTSLIYAIPLSAVLFSLFHFIGIYADAPNFPLFLIRFFGGCFLGCLYQLRGFGIAAYTHCIYDLIVVIYLTI
ncbi:MAG: hypothetical protein CMG69_05755 [Candidatus Marinimicrobia bacterium]|nr:hypothetical protein [Candidatus Neomarinimicrobiota bacterium]